MSGPVGTGRDEQPGEAFDPGEPITAGDLIEDYDGAPLPHELQRGGRISLAVWDVLVRRMPDEASPDQMTGCHEGVLIALAPILWPLLPSNDHAPRPVTSLPAHDDLPDEAVEATAEVLLAGYATEYDATHLTWRDFADDARSALAAALPSLRASIEAQVSDSRGAALITAERRRQVEVKGYTPEHDAEHVAGEFVSAAFSYAKHAMCTYAPSNPEAAPPVHEPPVYPYWPWSRNAFKPGEFTTAGAIRDLVKAGALIASEIDRLLAAGVARGELS